MSTQNNSSVANASASMIPSTEARIQANQILAQMLHTNQQITPEAAWKDHAPTLITLRQACYNVSDAIPLPSRAEAMLHMAISKTAEALETIDFCARRVPFDISHPTWRKHWLHGIKDCSSRIMRAFTNFLPVWIARISSLIAQGNQSSQQTLLDTLQVPYQNCLDATAQYLQVQDLLVSFLERQK